MAVIAPKARIRAPGKASANLLAAPSSVDPRVIMSSTKRISVGGGPDICRWTLRLAICSLGFGLSDGLLHADFFTAVTRTRHESTCLPNPLFAKAVAIRKGTQRVFASIRELLGTGTRIVSGWKKYAKGKLPIFCWIALAIHSDISIGGFPAKVSPLSASITSYASCIAGEDGEGMCEQ